MTRWTEHPLFTSPAPGCLLTRVENPAHRILLSCGIHGDETAPIEMLDRLIEDIADYTLIPAVEILFVIGNPKAIMAGQRFMEHDLNRLFDGQWRSKLGIEESIRACELENVTHEYFAGIRSHRCWHLDLHTTIRPSLIERFGIASVASKEQLPHELLHFLHCASIAALVLNPRSQGTYSAFSSHQSGAFSLTLELGRGKRFGENLPATTAPLEEALRYLIQGHPLPIPTTPELMWFEATREILRTPDRFAFHLPETVENFSPLEKGAPLAETSSGAIHAESGERILFPNPNVAPGLRAGLLVRPLPL